MRVCLGCKGHGDPDWICFDKFHPDPARRFDFDDVPTLRVFPDRMVTALRAYHSFEHMKRDSFVPFMLAMAKKCVPGCVWEVETPRADQYVSIGNPHHTNNIFMPYTFHFFGPPKCFWVDGCEIGSGASGPSDDWIFEKILYAEVVFGMGVRSIRYWLTVRSEV